MGHYVNNKNEWLEADGLGGFASGTVNGVRTRRYHGLLVCATNPPTRRFMLINGFDAHVQTTEKNVALSSQSYFPNAVSPDGAARINRFDPDPWPTWTYLLDDGTEIEQSIFMPSGASAAAVAWRAKGHKGKIYLNVRPFLSGRDHHALHRENPLFHFGSSVDGSRVRWRPYEGVPPVTALSNGKFASAPEWYRNFFYEHEAERGLDAIEDLAAPGVFKWDLSLGEAVLIFYADGFEGDFFPKEKSPEALLKTLRTAESERRKQFPTRLHRCADAYLVRRKSGRTIIAGYPWFADGGRDTFISMRGLCLTAGRLEEARQILLHWTDQISEGMVPNFFPDGGGAPEFNSADASLWYVVAIHEFLQTMKARRMDVLKDDKKKWHAAIEKILTGYEKGARYGIHMDKDGLLACGTGGTSLTWMDARVGERAVTPRVGKPVEIQALWLNALKIGGELSSRWKDMFMNGRDMFRRRFWNDERKCLFDVIDVYGQALTADAAFRPNQILAVGGLPVGLLEKDQARAVVDAVEEKLWTPAGLRTLAPGDPGYNPICAGNEDARALAYHQGAAWPWLLGPFIDAWVRVRGGTAEAKKQARLKFLYPLQNHADDAGLGHVSELADGEAPFTPRGCPFQAWSVGETMRIAYGVLEK